MCKGTHLCYATSARTGTTGTTAAVHMTTWKYSTWIIHQASWKFEAVALNLHGVWRAEATSCTFDLWLTASIHTLALELIMQFIEILLRVETACLLILMIAVRESSKQHQVRILVDKPLILYFLRRQLCTHVNCFFVCFIFYSSLFGFHIYVRYVPWKLKIVNSIFFSCRLLVYVLRWL